LKDKKMTVSESTSQPPAPPSGLAWIKENLFSSWFNGILTVISILVVAWILRGVLNWVFFEADWRPVIQSPVLFLFGQYPRDMLWRIGICMSLISILVGVSWGVWGDLIRSFAVTIGAVLALFAVIPFQSEDWTLAVRITIFVNILLIYLGFILAQKTPIKSTYVTFAWLLVIALTIFVLLPGFQNSELLPEVPTTLWGGLLVTLILAVGGIVLSFPIGVLLALGRRSDLPIVKGFCIAFIETIRGVPLVTILFMFSLILQVFLPAGSRFDRLLRALIAITIFSAAYMAENVRGGLAAVPSGQIEAANALGMRGYQISTFIILPQALKVVIPAIVGQFISLFKDTTLVIILGINELLGIGRAVINSDPQFIQLQLEVYLFIALIFWVFSYAMSQSSYRLESALGVGER
jgi:general L-amino acid transport system permease protein